jgi:hypothetical protein
MKKLLFAALLSLAGVGLGTGQASAWLRCHHCCAGTATICCKPYNAFSPGIFGSITADGCCPITFSNHGPACPPPGFGPPMPPPWWGGPGCCGPSVGCADGSCGHGGGAAVMAPPAHGTPTTLPAAGGAPTFQAPPPGPLPTGAPPGAQMLGAPGVQPAGYGPMPWMQPPAYPPYWANPNGR